MADTLKIVRLKTWSSREDRAKHPDWKNPLHLSVQELDDLARLAKMNRGAYRGQMEVMLKLGGDLIVAYDDSQRIVGSMAFAFVPTLEGLTCLVTHSRYESTVYATAHSELRAALHKIAESEGVTAIMSLENLARPAPRRSDISEIERAERFENILASGVSEDGPPTRELPTSAVRAARRNS